MTDIEKHTKANFGLDVIKTLGEVNHPGVWRDGDGAWHMDNATNTSLRLGLDMAMSEIKTLKTIIEDNKETLKDQRDLIRAQRKELEQVEDELHPSRGGLQPRFRYVPPELLGGHDL